MVDINYSLSQQLGNGLKARGLQVAVAESCTGGGLAQELTAVPGSSAWFDRGFVTYSNAAKMELLHVPTTIIETYGAVSEQTAAAMAAGVLENSCADLSVSITGVAGPAGGTPEKPVGLVWFGLAFKNKSIQTRHQYFTGGRKHIRRLAIGFALQWMINELELVELGTEL